MPRKLLPQSLNTASVAVVHSQSPFIRNTLACIGVVVILVGIADVMTRMGSYVFGSDTARVAFGPVSALDAWSSATAPLSGGSAATTSAALVPVQLHIPAIGVRAQVERVGKKADGTMATPSSFDAVAWYALGSKPGEAGSAVFAGHVNNARTSSGVFEHLSDVRIGDKVMVSDASGRTYTYMVYDIEEYPTGSAPLGTVFATSGPSRVVLITCQGDWVAADHSFDKRLVVYAELLE